jgi:transcriptional regulator with XRE-family HTH domain
MTDPATDRLSLARSLRELRNRSGLSTYELAERLGWSQSKLSRTERGEVTADPADVAALCSATGAPQELAASLVTAAESLANQTRSYRQAHSRGLARRQQEIGEVIASSSRYRAFGLAEVPGLLQTPLYAARILELADVSGRGGIPEAVAARMNRQALLYDPARSFEFVIAEWALAYQAGPPDVMHGQAAKIIDTMALPNVSLSVIPNGTNPGTVALSGFVIYEPPAGPWVLVEHLTGEDEIRAIEHVKIYETTFARLREAAVTGEAAQAVIRAAMSR